MIAERALWPNDPRFPKRDRVHKGERFGSLVERVIETAETTAQGSAISEMKVLVLEITKALVDEPEAVRLDVLSEGGISVLRLQVSPADLGKVIGKQGRTARSLRTILGAASMKLKQRFSLDIVEVGEKKPVPSA